MFPSVTQIIEAAGLSGDLSAIPPSTLEYARRRGIALHAAAEAHWYGLDVEMPDEYRPWWDAFLTWCDDMKPKLIVAEYEMEHPEWKVIGHLDAAVWIKAERTIIDVKARADIDELELGCQLSAYDWLWERVRPTEPIHKVLGVQLTPKMTPPYRLHPVTTKKYLPVFQAATIVWHAKNERNGGRT